ncbi:beta-arrestin-1 [Caerostris extrusa]|uniref:Beta-arrestin-1 n=1 Tax=Caerostris extrusa TaxID=172846 RepID=A0AAV4RP09_CAEEX|nr:beta-arrestin-1 [Caerostris extrusa]
MLRDPESNQHSVYGCTWTESEDCTIHLGHSIKLLCDEYVLQVNSALLPPHCPASVTLQPSPGDTGKPCGVNYELKAYVADSVDEKAHKRNSVRLAIRKIMYAPSRQVIFSRETIAVNVHIANNSNRNVKKIKVSVRQFADICLFSTAQYKCTVAEIESEEGCPIGPGFTLSKVYYLRPLLANNTTKRGLALDGQLKHEDTNLASSTIISDATQRENLGIIVQYKVKVKLCLGPLEVAELPFILMHPKPDDDPPPLPARNASTKPNAENENQGIDADLIRLDTDAVLDDGDDDLIFEDFARLRLRGETDA